MSEKYYKIVWTGKDGKEHEGQPFASKGNLMEQRIHHLNRKFPDLRHRYEEMLPEDVIKPDVVVDIGFDAH